jgi:hypothetical protein
MMSGMDAPPNPLIAAVAEVEKDTARSGWDQPPRLFALVPTADLLEREPQLALSFADREVFGELTAIQQEDVPADEPLDLFLSGIAWPAEVFGAVLAVERLIIPEEDGAPDDEHSLAAWAADHPGRQEVRMVVGVLRDGSRSCAIRLRSHDFDEAVLTGPDLVPTLVEALALTFAD